MVKKDRKIPRNIRFTSKRNIHSNIFIKLISDRQVLSNHSFDLSGSKLFSFHRRHHKSYNSKFCLNILEGIKCTTRYTVQKKSPVTVKHLHKPYSHFEGKLMSLSNLHAMICIISLDLLIWCNEVN